MTKYQRRKAASREEAISWQRDQADRVASYGELAEDQDRFKRLAKRYGLTEEFRENCII